jgi:peroxidase
LFARITNEFATAAFRVGHTLIPNVIHTLSRGGGGGRNLLRDMFFNIDTLRSRGGIDNLIRGVTQTPVEVADDNFSEEVSKYSESINCCRNCRLVVAGN